MSDFSGGEMWYPIEDWDDPCANCERVLNLELEVRELKTQLERIRSFVLYGVHCTGEGCGKKDETSI